MDPNTWNERLLHIPSFVSAAMEQKRGMRIYLPPGYYEEPGRRYPVLYMHDGQGIFHPNPFSNNSWNIHRTADRLIAEGLMEEIIIVGIDNRGEERINEYAFAVEDGCIPDAPDIVCKGEAYERFLIEELKPYIDRSLRTLPGREHTALMGSSMGGLATYHIGFRNGHIFSKLGILSPYFIRLNPNTLEETRFYNRYTGINNMNLWVDVGEVEANILVRHVRGVIGELMDQGYVPSDNLMFYEVPGAAHTEKDWADRVHMPLLYFFGNPGKPVAAKLYGRTEFGLTGMSSWLNPVVSFDSGFRMTDLNGVFETSDPSLLEVNKDGVVRPFRKGNAQITYRGKVVNAQAETSVVEHLSEMVKVSIRIRVPVETPAKEAILIGKLAVPRISEQLFGGVFHLPRDMAVRYKVVTDSGVHEAGPNGEFIPYRIQRLNEDTKLEYRVEAWEKQNGSL
ncbi:alpha/beta hydrolase [Fontibacillus sp. BL9]|uniref:alpha/beta hydrolase n=1 Tax=Fontibacillus sp. BL9 TaxID=3389971 RepID=UPI00397A261A